MTSAVAVQTKGLNCQRRRGAFCSIKRGPSSEVEVDIKVMVVSRKIASALAGGPNLFNRHLAFAIGAALFFIAVPLSATPTPVPLFNECPHQGNALGCSYLVDFGPSGSLSLLPDSGALDVDSNDDILIGILNNSGI
jgi:hypothetical protein